MKPLFLPLFALLLLGAGCSSTPTLSLVTENGFLGTTVPGAENSVCVWKYPQDKEEKTAITLADPGVKHELQHTFSQGTVTAACFSEDGGRYEASFTK